MRIGFHNVLSVTQGLVCLLLLAGLPAIVSAGQDSSPAVGMVILVIEGPEQEVKWMRRDFPGRWEPVARQQTLYPGDWLLTGPRNRVLLQYSKLETFWIDKRTQLRIPEQGRGRRILELFRGVLYFFHRDKPDELEIRTRLVNSVVRGTEFNLRVDDDDTTTLTLLDGEVEMSNEFGPLTLQSGEEGRVEPGKAPVSTALLNSMNTIQWCLYYPAVLDSDELPLNAEERGVLVESLGAYRSGDLLAALSAYPAERQPTSDEEKLYLAALLLSVGQVERTETLLNELKELNGLNGAMARALRRLIAAVKMQPDKSPHPSGRVRSSLDDEKVASALLAESYYQQAQTQGSDSLKTALALARQAVQQSTNFAFGWARVAELEFSFGHTRAAREAVEKSLQFAPRNAQALALKGFLAAARNDISEAIRYFDQAIAIDGALGNAWLGRGLCRIRRGEAEAGRLELQIAATVEPQRALLRSYLGKAFSHAGDDARAAKELELAKTLDPNDPTAWLYSALLNRQRNRINEAVRDLEHSQELNENRSVYRSRLLLDQDQAVRGANLATLYGDAGMTEVSAREAARAVGFDYANYSAHLFLADSFNALRDPRQINLRYETPWFSEYLVANLLAPVEAGTLSPFVTQQDYARLFERNRVGLSSATEYLSRGDWLQTAALYGIHDRLSYATEIYYRSETGDHQNGDLEQLAATARFKYELTPHDRAFLQATWYRTEAGDVTPRYNPADANPDLRTRETQEPTLLAGYHHQWSPGIDTLLLAGRVAGTLDVVNPRQQTLVLEQTGTNGLTSAGPVTIGQDYRSETEIYSAELQQILQRQPHTVILGARAQAGEFATRNAPVFTDATLAPFFTADQFVSVTQHVRPDFDRLTAYGYYHLRVAEPLLFIGGVTYDHLTYPENFRYAPLSAGEQSTERVSPKAGFIWTPWTTTTLRGAWSRSLGGVAYDQSFQLEPTQIAGFNQTWRSLIPEAVAGANAAARFESFGLALDQKFPTRTYLGVSAELLKSEVKRTFGVYDDNSTNVVSVPPFIYPSATPQHLDYEERVLIATLNQLLGEEWSLGARYRISRADLQDRFPDIPPGTPGPPEFSAQRHDKAILHQLNLVALHVHPSGFFAQAEALWRAQHNAADSSGLRDDDFWQFNAFVGYRFARRRVELRLGLLNITDQDYRLNPLNLTLELPRERTALVSLRFNF